MEKRTMFAFFFTFSVVILQKNIVCTLPYSEQNIVGLSAEVGYLRTQVEILQNRLNITEQELKELKERPFIHDDIAAISAKPNAVSVNKPLASTDPVIDISLDTEVGFSAKLSHELHDLPTFSVIKYDYVIFNAGNAYDPITGIFTVPTEGMYMFTFFVEAIGTRAAEVQLIVDGMIRFPAISEPESVGNDDTGGNMVIEHLVKGQQVWIETYDNEQQNIYPGFTTFSGALIK